MAYADGGFYILGEDARTELTAAQFEYFASKGCTLIMDLEAFGLAFIKKYMDASLGEVRLVSYNLVIRRLTYRRLVLKSSSLFGVNNDEISVRIVKELNRFIWKHAKRTLVDPRIVSASSVASVFISEANCFLKGPNCEQTNLMLEKSYYGGRLEVFRHGYIGDVSHYDFRLMYGSLLAESLPTELRPAEVCDISSPGFYEISFTSASESLSCVLPTREGRGVSYSRKGRGVYWYEEIAWFVEAGGIVDRVYGGLEVAAESGFLRKASERLIADRAAGCRFSKLTLNNVYGRFAAKHNEASDFLVRSSRQELGDEDFKFGCYTMFEDLRLVKGEGVKSGRARTGNLAAASAITAKARVKLNRLVREVEKAGCEVVYVDTDSVVFVGDYGTAEQGFKKRREYAILGPRSERWSD